MADELLCCVTCRVMTRQQNECPVCGKDDDLLTIPEIRSSLRKWKRRNGILAALAAERISILEKALNEVMALRCGSGVVDTEELSPVAR